ncbi:hypothetical protein O0L34_g7653 [Tuta absoluta]|nr:hypothetical protein O0L34_g7653 [Tuta absoluta]
MDDYKKFITHQRYKEIEKPYIMINVNISPRLYDYLKALEDNKFRDGEYHKYCGQIKHVINNFLIYWEEIITECIKEADTLIHTLDKKGLVQLIKNTKELQRIKQEEYLEEFGQAENEQEQKILDDMYSQYNSFLHDIDKMEKHVNRFAQQEKTTEFLKTQLEVSISKKNAAFELLHSYLAEALAKYSSRIRVSFEEILKRLTNNLRKKQEEHAKHLNTMMEELYDANKNRLMVSRQYRHRASAMVEVDNEINKIQSKIEQSQEERPFAQLKEEIAYWEKKTSEFQKIEETIQKCQKELKRVNEYLERYKSMACTEYPGTKKTAWDIMGVNYTRRKTFLENTLHNTSRSIISFFAVPGQDRIIYKDDIGPYTIDEYGHQIYYFDYWKNVYHKTCSGKLVEIEDKDKYYYDEIGRYILDANGAKVYQIAACCSSYKLNDDVFLEKTTKDCGHSETPNRDCKINFKNPHTVELLPAYDPVDIKQTLTPEVAKYIWDSVAYILTDAVHDTGIKQSHNPIYTLANRIMFHKYHKNSTPELKKKMKEAEKYRANIYKGRNEKANAEALAYKAKQVQPRKPAEYDDTETQQVLATLAAKQQLKAQLTTYYQDF